MNPRERHDQDDLRGIHRIHEGEDVGEIRRSIERVVRRVRVIRRDHGNGRKQERDCEQEGEDGRSEITHRGSLSDGPKASTVWSK